VAYILVVDDDKEVVGTVERSLSRQGHRVAAAYNGLQALESVQQQRPDLMVLDIIMPQMDGIEVCRRLRADPATVSVPILILTAKGRIEDKVEGFEAGCDDYLPKPFALKELELRVEALLRRTLAPRVSKSPLRAGPLCLDPRTFKVSVEGKSVLLTPMEYELLNYLMVHAGEVIPSEELLKEVWGYPPGTGDPDLVRAHIRNLRTKVELSPNNPTYIQTVPRHGYIIPK